MENNFLYPISNKLLLVKHKKKKWRRKKEIPYHSWPPMPCAHQSLTRTVTKPNPFAFWVVGYTTSLAAQTIKFVLVQEKTWRMSKRFQVLSWQGKSLTFFNNTKGENKLLNSWFVVYDDNQLTKSWKPIHFAIFFFRVRTKWNCCGASGEPANGVPSVQASNWTVDDIKRSGLLFDSWF